MSDAPVSAICTEVGSSRDSGRILWESAKLSLRGGHDIATFVEKHGIEVSWCEVGRYRVWHCA